MTIDQIKQCVKYADGFVIDFNMDGVQSLCSYSTRGGVFSCFLSECVNYPTYSLFLTRVIEGINREGKTFLLIQRYDCIQTLPVKTTGSGYVTFYFDNYENIDQAKEAAIIFVLEHEA